MKTINYWTDQVPHPENLAGGELPSQSDVAIVGGGYTGLNAALVLRKAGASVTVLEAQTIGWGASSRNGGMLTPGIKAPLRDIFKRYGLENARFFWRWSLDAIDYVAEVVAQEEIECDFSRPGHVALAFKPSHYENYKSYQAWMKSEIGYDGLKLVPPAELETEIGSRSYHGGLSDDHTGALHPAKYVFGLACAASQQGVQLVENAEVNAIQHQNGGFRLHTPKGEIQAKEVLLATNGYTSGLVPRVRQGIFPVGSYIIVTPPLPPDLQAELSPKGRMFYDSKLFLNYFRLTSDGRMLFGGRNNLSTRLDLRKSARLLRARMVEVFPQLAEYPVTHTWTGQLGITFDLMPHIGQINGVHYAYGYSGHGVSIASHLGKEVGLLLSGEKSSSPFGEIYHPRSFIANLDRLYLPFVAAWYRVLDRTR